jgi:hypothetical protein
LLAKNSSHPDFQELNSEKYFRGIVLRQWMLLLSTSGPSQCEIHGKGKSVEIAAVGSDRMPDIGGKDQHQAGARVDFDVITIADRG